MKEFHCSQDDYVKFWPTAGDWLWDSMRVQSRGTAIEGLQLGESLYPITSFSARNLKGCMWGVGVGGWRWIESERMQRSSHPCGAWQPISPNLSPIKLRDSPGGPVWLSLHVLPLQGTKILHATWWGQKNKLQGQGRLLLIGNSNKNYYWLKSILKKTT